MSSPSLLKEESPAVGSAESESGGAVTKKRGGAPFRNWGGYRLRGKRARDREPARVDSVLRSLLSRPRYHEKLSKYSFVTNWHDIVGARVAQHAKPLKVVRGELYIQVANPIWAQELAFYKPAILSRLKKHASSDLTITDLRFVVTDNL